MEKNIVEVVMNNKGEVIEKIADYVGVKSFAKTIENLYHECLNNYDNAEDIEEFLADCCGENIQALAWEFTLVANREMKNYLHRKSQHMDGNFADLSVDYPKHRTGTFWVSEYDGPVVEYFSLYPDMVARLDAAEDSKQADEDRAYLREWYFGAFGTFGIKYNFDNNLSEIAYELEQECVTA